MSLAPQLAEPTVLKCYRCVYDARYEWLYVSEADGLAYWSVVFPAEFRPPVANETTRQADWFLVDLEGYVSELGEFGTSDFPLSRSLQVETVVHIEKLE